MKIYERIFAIYAIFIALIVAIHAAIEPLYYTSTSTSPTSPFWLIINIGIAVLYLNGFLLITRYVIKKDKRFQDSIGTILIAGFYGLAVIYCRNFFSILNIDTFKGETPTSFAVSWMVFDVLYPCILFGIGRRLLKSTVES